MTRVRIHVLSAFLLLVSAPLVAAASVVTVAPTTSYDGNYVVSWTNTTGLSYPRVYLASSTNGGATWTKTAVTASTTSRTFTAAPPGTYSYKVLFYEYEAELRKEFLFEATNVASVVVASQPGLFTLTAPASGATGVEGPVVLDWTDALRATSYRVVITQAGTTTPTVDTSVATSTLSVPPQVLAPQRTYTWQVTAINGSGATQASNGPFTFTTAGATVVAFDWWRPKRYGIVGPYGFVIHTNPYDAMEVVLDACGSRQGYWPITGYTFTTNRPGSVPVTQTGCSFSVTGFPGEGFTATVAIRDAGGGVRTALVTPLIVDRLVVSVGDSYASGEGNPDVPQVGDIWNPESYSPALWENQACDRSHFSPGGFAAAKLEDADPKSSVTFLSEACAFRTTAHVIDTQVPNLTALLQPPAGRAPRHVDLFTVGIGGNDMNFLETLFLCLLGTLEVDHASQYGDSCVGMGRTESYIAAGKREIPARLDAVIAAIRGMTSHVDAETEIVLTEYPNPTQRVHTGDWIFGWWVPVTPHDEYCTMVNMLDPIAIYPSESKYFAEAFGRTLNEIVLSAAARNHVAFTAGTWDAAAPHGYCSDAQWVNTLDQARAKQGCGRCKDDLPCFPSIVEAITGDCISWGVLHPNEAGAEAIGDGILKAAERPSGIAVYDSSIGTPVCSVIGNACVAGPPLIGGAGPSESHSPNALSDGTDGTVAGPSIDSLTVVSVDRTPFAPGDRVAVHVDTTVLAPGTSISVWYTGRALQGGNRYPTWTPLATFTPTASGANTFLFEYVLPEGALHGLRAAAIPPEGVASGAWDVDNLVFFTTGEDSCPSTWLKCGDSCSNNNDASNCGRCGYVCPVPVLGATSCVDGECKPYCTETGFVLVDGRCEPAGTAAP